MGRAPFFKAQEYCLGLRRGHTPKVCPTNVDVSANQKGSQSVLNCSCCKCTNTATITSSRIEYRRVNTPASLFLLSVYHWGKFPSLPVPTMQEEVKGNHHSDFLLLRVLYSPQRSSNTTATQNFPPSLGYSSSLETHWTPWRNSIQ